MQCALRRCHRVVQCTASSHNPSPAPLNGSSDDISVALRKRRTIESTQPPTTRAGNSGSKHFNYSKLINDRTAAALQADKLRRSVRDAHSRSLNQVREDLLIDLELPPSTTPVRKHAGAGAGAGASHNVSLLDQPIDVPELGLEPDWGESNVESLPSIPTQNAKNYSTLHGAKSLDNLAMPLYNTRLSLSQPDPFDTSQAWPIDQHIVPTPSVVTPRPNYEIQMSQPASQNNLESHIYSNSRYATSTSHKISQTPTYNNAPTQIYNNSSVNRSDSTTNRSIHGGMPNTTYANSNALSLERNIINSESSIANSLAEMSLDDRISTSLNLKTKNSENIYANSEATSSAAANRNDRYQDIPIYNNYDTNTAQQQFILETKDYYTKFSTPQSTKSSNDYEKNIYVPKQEDEAEKLRNFSESVENSKNYSALKYQNVDYSQYGYGSSASNWSSTWSVATYDEVNVASGNIYSEIREGSAVGDEGAWVSNQGRARPSAHSAQGGHSTLYDEVYEAPAPTPRPHRPAPPRPSNPK